jgi:hypothetical protein
MAEITLDEFAPFLKREGVSRRKVFGMDSLLVNGHVFLSLAPTGVVYKMNETGSQKALTNAGADMFQPPMPGAPKMKGWVEVPFVANADWLQLAEYAYEHVSTLPPKVYKKK